MPQIFEAPIASDPRVLALRKQFAAKVQRTVDARSDLGVFIQTVVQDDHGAPLELSDMHRAWLTHVTYCWQNNLKAIVLAHFGAGKSSTLAVPAVAWMLGHSPGLRAKVVTNDDANAVRRVSGISNIMESPIYSEIFPAFKKGTKWTDHELYVQRQGHALDPSVQARGVLTTGIGGRADLIVFDDVVDQRNSMDPGQRRKVAALIDGTWLSRLEPDAKVLYVATLWHLDDATHHLIDRRGWCTLKQSVSADCQSIEQEVFGAGDNYPVV
jgi:hypothetical protein